MPHPTEVALTYYDGWPLWAVITTSTFAVLFSLMTAVTAEDIQHRLSLPAATVLLAGPPLAVVATWQSAMHMRSPEPAFLLYLALMLGLTIGVWRSLHDYNTRTPIRTYIICVCLVVGILCGIWEALRRVAASIPMATSGLVAILVIGGVAVYLHLNER